MSCCEAGCAPLRRGVAGQSRRPATTGTPWGFSDARNLAGHWGRRGIWSTRSMSSLLEAGFGRSPTDVHAARLATPVVPVTPLREGILQLEQALPLHYGGSLEGVRVAWRVTGNPDGPLVAALGGISAGRAVADIGT